MSSQRKFLKMADWEKTQNPKRPKIPPWIKLHREWLNLPKFRNLSAANRGILFSMQMLCMELGNRVPYDTSFIAQKIGLRPAVAGKALCHLIITGFLLEFAEEADASDNNDLEQIMRSDRAPLEGEIDRDIDKDTHPKGMEIVQADKCTEQTRTILRSRKQPDFEILTKTCLSAGVRGSDYAHITEVLEKMHGITPSPKQLPVLERQLIDRSGE